MAAHRTLDRWAVLLAALLAGSAMLSACRNDDRVVFYKPHVYKGRIDPALQPETVAELSERAKQGGRI